MLAGSIVMQYVQYRHMSFLHWIERMALPSAGQRKVVGGTRYCALSLSIDLPCGGSGVYRSNPLLPAEKWRVRRPQGGL